MKKIIIIGATSGIGKELASHYLAQGDIIGITGRRTDRLQEIRQENPSHVFVKEMDIKTNECTGDLDELINDMGGDVDVIILCSGVGLQNPKLETSIEVDTGETNVIGFIRIMTHAFNYFRNNKRKGHLVGISSIAGTKALRQAPAYSSTKRFQSHYLSCLAQQANKEKLPLKITTIKPGFIRTALVKQEYPLMIDVQTGGRLIFNAIEKQKRSSILPGRWRWIVLFWKLIPNRIWEKVY